MQRILSKCDPRWPRAKQSVAETRRGFSHRVNGKCKRAASAKQTDRNGGYGVGGTRGVRGKIRGEDGGKRGLKSILQRADREEDEMDVRGTGGGGGGQEGTRRRGIVWEECIPPDARGTRGIRPVIPYKIMLRSKGQTSSKYRDAGRHRRERPCSRRGSLLAARPSWISEKLFCCGGINAGLASRNYAQASSTVILPCKNITTENP